MTSTRDRNVVDLAGESFDALEAAIRDARLMLLYARDRLAATGDHGVAMTFEREADLLALACLECGMSIDGSRSADAGAVTP
jgi:hypothetical protein